MKGQVQKREKGHRFFVGDKTFPFLEIESYLGRYCQVFSILLPVDKACLGESTQMNFVC